MAVTGFLARKRLAWHTYLDMPVGLTLPQAIGAGMACQIDFGEPALSHPGPYEGGAKQGWVVLLGITNPGHATVRSTDFTTPLTFAFPGRQIHATQVLREPTVPAARRRLRIPVLRAPAAHGPDPGLSGRLHLTGDYALHPDDSYVILLVLSGIPAAHTRPIREEGSLPGGTIAPGASPPGS